MRTFTDTADRSWSVVIDIDAARRVRQLLGVNLMEATNPDFLAKLQVDVVLLVDLIYAICKPAADAKGITAEQFGQALAGDAIEAASDAFMEGLVDFFPSRTRTPLQRVLAAGKSRREAEGKLLTAAIDQVVKDLESIPGGSSPNSPASSDSTPAA